VKVNAALKFQLSTFLADIFIVHYCDL